MNFGIALRRCITQRNGPWARVTLPTAPDKHTISAGKGCKTAQVAAAVTLPLHRIAFRPVSLGQRARILSLRKMPARDSDSVHETVDSLNSLICQNIPPIRPGHRWNSTHSRHGCSGAQHTGKAPRVLVCPVKRQMVGPKFPAPKIPRQWL